MPSRVTERTATEHSLPANGTSAREGASSSGGLQAFTAWQYHPRTAQTLTKRWQIQQAAILSVGKGGERWLTQQDGSHVSHAALTLAPETLEGGFETAAHQWVFVGQSGTTYWAPTPLAPFSRQVSAPQSMVQTVVSSGTILAIGKSQRLWRSTDAGTHWQRIGSQNARFSDVWFDSPRVLALQTPEALWWSLDDGTHLSLRNQMPFGVSHLRTSSQQQPVAMSPLGNRLVAENSLNASSATGLSLTEAPQLPAPARVGPSAGALRIGRAVLTADYYAEVVMQPHPQLLSGLWDRSLRAKALPQLARCNKAQIAGFERWLYIACSRRKTRAVTLLEMYRSSDRGQSFQHLSSKMYGFFSRLRMAVGAQGVVAITGICPDRDSSSGCNPRGIHHIKPLPAKVMGAVHWAPIPAPALEGPALGLQFADNGQGLLAVGRRTKNEWLYSFTTTEVKRGLTPHNLQIAHTPSVVVQSLSTTSTGDYSILLSGVGSRAVIIQLDSEGHLLTAKTGPTAQATMGIWGHHALAHTGKRLWYSSNSGADWKPIRAPLAALCPLRNPDCKIAIECRQEGCVLDDRTSRKGWPAVSKAPPELKLEGLEPESALEDGSAMPGLGCQLHPGPWRALPGVRRMPRAPQAALGKTPLYALSYDYERGTCGTWEFSANADTPPTYHPLLAANSAPGQFALAPSLQVEGAAAIRYRVSADKGSIASTPQRVEVAWIDYLTNTKAKHRVAVPGGFLPTDYDRSRKGSHRARPDLISIAAGDLFLRAHSSGQANQSTVWIKRSGKTSLSAPVQWPQALRQGRPEVAQLEGEPVPLMFLDNGSTVVRATRVDGRWLFSAMATGNSQRAPYTKHFWDIAYAPTGVGIARTTHYADGTVEGRLHPLQLQGSVFGNALEIPTQHNLLPFAPACTTEQRQNTPRIVAPSTMSSRRQVSITEPLTAPRFLRTNTAILHGTPGSPCLAAYDATGQPRSPSARERAIITPGKASWLLRTAPTSTRRKVEIEYRPMSCSWTAPSGSPTPSDLAPSDLAQRR